MSECDAIIKQRATTTSTSTSTYIPVTSEHNKSNNINQNGGGWKIFVILICCILLICIVLNIVYCKYKSKKLKIAHERLEEEPEEGDINVADIAQMFHDPI